MDNNYITKIYKHIDNDIMWTTIISNINFYLKKDSTTYMKPNNKELIRMSIYRGDDTIESKRVFCKYIMYQALHFKKDDILVLNKRYNQIKDNINVRPNCNILKYYHLIRLFHLIDKRLRSSNRVMIDKPIWKHLIMKYIFNTK
jgi:hypothetical protein